MKWPTTIPLFQSMLALVIVCLCLILPSTGNAQESLLTGGWKLDRSASSLQFQSVKNGSKVETSSFANFDGYLDESGRVTLLVELNSIDTKIDLRNVRMRFLFFETFRHPNATVTTKVEESTMQELLAKRRVKLPVEFELDLHGFKKKLIANVVLTMFTEDRISVSSSTPVTVPADGFNLMDGILKLQEAANVVIVPSGSVSFDFTFSRNSSANENNVFNAENTPEQSHDANKGSSQQPASVALESKGNFSEEECAGRFEVLSQAGAINFAFASSELDKSSFAFLESLLDVIQRCPAMRIVVAGHTDSTGSDAANMKVSSDRAERVTRYLLENDVAVERIRSVGFGESRPLVPNDSTRNRARNRRIEFMIDGR